MDTEFARFVIVPSRSLPIVPENRKLVGPLTIEFAQKTPIFTGYLPIRISQVHLKLPPFTPQEIRGEK